jgi:hypothetical protein
MRLFIRDSNATGGLELTRSQSRMAHERVVGETSLSSDRTAEVMMSRDSVLWLRNPKCKIEMESMILTTTGF